MLMPSRLPLVLLTLAVAIVPARAAGGGAGAGGAGHQRAINSGLPAGDAGPPGSPNNLRPSRTPSDGVKGSPRGANVPAR